MASTEYVAKAVRDYEEQFRRPDLEKLQVSGLYALVPDRVNREITLAGRWNKDPWPNAERPGVYIIFDDKLELLYIGKASCKSTLGGRLYNYFREDEVDHSCRVRHEGWSRTPGYVMTVAVPALMPFEAPALEEYLIAVLKPRDNTVGIHLRD